MASGEHQHRRVARQDFLVGQLGPFKRDALGQRLCRNALDSGLGLARREAGRRATVHIGGQVAVVAHGTFRAKAGLDLHQRRQRHHLARAGAHLERSHVLSPRTVGRIGLHAHAVGATKLVEVVGVQAAQVDLQVSKMSVTGTPSWRALVRSMLAYSCGTLTCQLVNKPASSGVW